MKKATTNTVSIFTFKLFEKMSMKYGGETTINELRVMNCAYYYHFADKVCYQKTMVKQLGITKSTVSRSVFNLVKKGWLVEVLEEDDRRLHRLCLGEQALCRAESDWQESIDWWEDAMEER